MIHEALLKILVCPESKQPVSLASDVVVQKVNEQIRARALKNRAGGEVCDEIDGALIRQDGRYAYPIRDSIPILLIDEGFEPPA
ncbi:MAG: hypothetical protein IT290_11605 [Deltaproteobacteria bacterium]|nr:hypothetical protein [Deltaproteobacteria bacterium]